ncbi:unnamed protein product [Didymodactylos carnosus]|uniref:Innexin n=1 Tax=Didymodactylos carnosus TaxID=1234261 RepID=A0A815IIP0_9BILA|nr:unnamed protein product [Didymodactylos carnosus]CAF1366480.1 unnamed protein product [Didymodactylos carnosus]CAF3982561.1 unnamed protein product [Didymodactylos carnosus]CAF4249162.1 unnamed protein product [Didymodactylos carnosus]
MDFLSNVVGQISKYLKNRDDDSIDRLNRLYTVVLLTSFAALTMSDHYVGNKINCWIPADLSDSQANYAHDICWIDDKSIYYLSDNDSLLLDPTHSRAYKITYYPWIPLLFIFMAFCFIFPYLIWQTLSHRTGT